MVNTSEVIRQVSEVAIACEEKKAEDFTVLELDKDAGGFTDYFVICAGTNPRQIQTISDAVQQRLSKTGVRPAHVEGYQQAEWVLLDYVDFVVHVFSQKARAFYNLERLWKTAKPLTVEELRQKVVKKVRTGRPRKATSTALKAKRTRASKPASTARKRSRPDSGRN